MCQSKALGGKRCFAHHPGTKASISYVHLKTGIDKEQIYAIMKELRKEGKNLEAPSPEELEKYFSLEEFKAKYDNSLSDQEKVSILKQLLSARSEADRNGVSGGVFHSWKNALKATVDKIKKPLVAFGVGSVLLLTACTGQAGITPGPSGGPSNGGSPSEQPTVVACSTENPGPYGDVIPKEEVTDEFGEYCKTTIDPNSDALKWDESKVDLDSLKKYGYTVEEAKEAQKNAVTFVAEQTFDSERLDNYSQSPTAWVEENSDYLADPSVYLTAVKDNKLSDAGLLVTDYLPSPIVRDGGPRFTESNIQVNRIFAFESTNGKKALAVEMGANSFYAVDNEQVVDLYLDNNKKTEEQLRKDNPELFEARPVGLAVSGIFSFSYLKGDMQKIAGSNSKWSVGTQDGVTIVE